MSVKREEQASAVLYLYIRKVTLAITQPNQSV